MNRFRIFIISALLVASATANLDTSNATEAYVDHKSEGTNHENAYVALGSNAYASAPVIVSGGASYGGAEQAQSSYQMDGQSYSSGSAYPAAEQNAAPAYGGSDSNYIVPQAPHHHQHHQQHHYHHQQQQQQSGASPCHTSHTSLTIPSSRGEIFIHRPAAIVVNRPPTQVYVNHAPLIVKPATVVLHKPPPAVIHKVQVKNQPRPVKYEPIYVNVVKPPAQYSSQPCDSQSQQAPAQYGQQAPAQYGGQQAPAQYEQQAPAQYGQQAESYSNQGNQGYEAEAPSSSY